MYDKRISTKLDIKYWCMWFPYYEAVVLRGSFAQRIYSQLEARSLSARRRLHLYNSDFNPCHIAVSFIIERLSSAVRVRLWEVHNGYIFGEK